jgi:tRNA (guanine-N7-)-methyltransferase
VTAGQGAPGSFFGRRKGKQLRPGQAERLERLLPPLRVSLPEEASSILDPAELFRGAVREVWLEIGFGGGEHLAHQARAYPEVGFIGVEPFVNGTVKLLAAVEDEGLSNVRVWDDDATHLLPRLAPGSLDRVYLLYPDPWPKRRQRKRRFLSEANVAALARVMRRGAELCFATDIDDYAGWALARTQTSSDFAWTARQADDWRKPWPGWPGTRYEAKARREGRASSYLTFRRL